MKYFLLKMLLKKSQFRLNGGCGTTAGWKTSPYVHLLLGGKPRASCTPHSDLPGWVSDFGIIISNSNLNFPANLLGNVWCVLSLAVNTGMVILSLIYYHYCNFNCQLWLELLGENSNPFNTTDVVFKIKVL